jgi:hypothetical protein
MHCRQEIYFFSDICFHGINRRHCLTNNKVNTTDHTVSTICDIGGTSFQIWCFGKTKGFVPWVSLPNSGGPQLAGGVEEGQGAV